MSLDTLQIIWFILWAVIWIAYFSFDSFTIGNGMLFPFITKDRQDRNQMQEIVGPFWNGAEVWLLTAGGGTFAAFPAVYANMFSKLYVPFFLVLFCLIFRAVGLELMHKDENPKWVSSFKWAYAISSFLLAFIFGVFFSNLFKGLAFDDAGVHFGLFDLFSMYAIIGGFLFVCLFVTIGSTWIHLRAEGPIVERSYKIAKVASLVCAGLLALYYVATINLTPLFNNFSEQPVLYIVPAISLITGIAAVLLFLKKSMAWSFTLLIATILFVFATAFIGLFPNMLPSSMGDQYSYTLHNASSSQHTLQIMFIVACIFVPIILAYQFWVHFKFSGKIKKEDAHGY